MRRRLAAGLVIAGAALLAFSGGTYALGAVRADDARTAWDAAQARFSVSASRTATRNAAVAEPIVPGAPVARLLIPRIGLDEIVVEGVDGDELNAGPGHLPGSALPGEPGNAVVSAHRDRHFRHFDALSIGDTLTTESSAGIQGWIIVSKRVLDENAPALFTTRDATLTLTTCWPIHYLGPAPERLIVTAKPLRPIDQPPRQL